MWLSLHMDNIQSHKSAVRFKRMRFFNAILKFVLKLAIVFIPIGQGSIAKNDFCFSNEDPS